MKSLLDKLIEGYDILSMKEFDFKRLNSLVRSFHALIEVFLRHEYVLPDKNEIIRLALQYMSKDELENARKSLMNDENLVYAMFAAVHLIDVVTFVITEGLSNVLKKESRNGERPENSNASNSDQST